MADSEGKGAGNGADGGGTAGQDEKLAQFIAFTGTTEEVANHWLEANAYSVESAVNMFMESGGSSGMVGASEHHSMAGGGRSGPRWRATTGGGSNGDGGAGPSSGDPDYVRPADPYKRQRLVDDVRPHGYGGMSTVRSWGATVGGAMPFRDFAQESRDASNALSVNGNSSSNPASDRQRKLAAMFSPPTKIMFMGDFQMARQTAKMQKKCLLVNIQSDSEFDCHKLNRDVWKDETVENIVECKCIFWQQQSISEEAKTYCRRYNVVGFPHIALIDPRTGMKVWGYQGYLGPPEFIEKVTDIMDKMSLEDGAPVRLPPPPPPGPQLPPSAGGSEDQMVAAAIAESLKDSKNSFISTSSSSTMETNGGEGGNSGMGVSRRSGDGNRCVLPNGGAGSSASLPASVHDSDENDEDYDDEGCNDVIDDDDDDDDDGVIEEGDDDDDDVAVLGSSAPVTSLSASPARGRELRSWDSRGSGTAAGLVSTVAAATGGGSTLEGDVVQGRGKGKRKARDVGMGSSSGISRDLVDMTADDDVSPSSSHSIGRGEGLVTNSEEISENVPEEEVLEEEPEDGNADVVKVRFRFPTGLNELRRFQRKSQVKQLYLFVMAKLDGAKFRQFDVRTGWPPKSVRDQERSSIEEAGLSNSTVVVAWED